MNLDLNQKQNLILSAALKQAFLVLQMPHLELAEWLTVQIEQNPLLEYQETKGEHLPLSEEGEINFEQTGFEVLDSLDESFQTAVFPDFAQEQRADPSPYHLSLYEHLMQQAQLAFETKEELAKAEQVIGNLDDRGFIGDLSVDEAVLRKIQTFDPPGIAARNLQESLLLQLQLRGKASSLALQLIRDYFELLLQRRFPDLAKKLHCTLEDLKATLQKEIASLNLSPGGQFNKMEVPPLVPDVVVRKEGGSWVIEVCQGHLPRFQLAKPPTPTEKSEKSYVRRHIAEGKWLLRMIRRRHDTLRRIVQFLLEKQAEFFAGDLKKLVPMAMHEVATILGVHESTVARAVSHKYLSCPLGILSLRIFFSQGVTTSSGKKVSNRTVRQMIEDVIQKEDKESPLSDDEIAKEIQKTGIPCARRTVSKHRSSLKLPPAFLRKAF